MSRFNCTVPVDEYLADSNVLFYLSDAVTQLLEHKEEYTQFGVIRYFAEYRLLVTAVLSLSSRIVLMDDAIDCLMSFSDFLYAFQLQFYYQEFLDSVLMIYQDLLSGKSPNTVIVPTSTSIEQLPSVAAEDIDREEQQQDGVEPSTLAQCIDALCDRFKRSMYDEGSTCCKNINSKTCCLPAGALPSKAELLIDPEMDQELDKLIAQISVSPGSNSSGSAVGGLKEVQRKASPRRNIHHRRKMEVESDGSTEETDSSEN
ncbi:UPF0705 protein C11orf49-like protein [Larimichthys crocea]|uniref:Uncharacterized protein n=1 Tax=Larimichthys crocea TaxID=215358 RepID=A0ACD3QEW8_LARCR|nr:UPF0705 protein C11orf49-like protein [Larimichthys crocea]